MSNPPAASKTSASGTSTPPGIHHEYNSSAPAPPTGSKSVTPGATASAFSSAETPDNKPDPSPPIRYVKRAATSGDDSPLLSERESIFATHYLPSDNDDPTPRLSAAEGAGDVANLPQDLNTVMEFALPSSPLRSPTSLRTLLSPRKSRSAQVENDVDQQKLTDPPVPSTKRLEESKGTIRTVRRVASEGQPGKQVLQLRVKHQQHLSSAESLGDLISRGNMASVTNNAEEKPGHIPESNQLWRGRGSAMKETFQQTAGRERSTSLGRTHVEKSIEATLPNREPTKNARTRKSSHLMGIFKGTAPSDSKRRDGQPRIAQARHEAGEEGGRRMPLRENSEAAQLCSQSAFFRTSSSVVEEPSRFTTGAEATDQRPNEQAGDPHIYSVSSGFATPSDLLYSPRSTPVTMSEPEHDPYFRKRDEISNSIGGQTARVIPTKLLEDIRRHHNLTPVGYRGATLSHSLPSLADVDSSAQLGRTPNVRVQDPGDHDEEDEEHISSAVYFPHPGPSDEDIEQFISRDEGQLTEPFPALPTPVVPTPIPEIKRTLSDVAPAEHIDISVRSEHEEKLFHGNYTPSEEHRQDSFERKPPVAIRERPSESISSAFRPEVGSGDELHDPSQAEEGEVISTSIPAPQPLLQRRGQPPTATAPKGAVMLEPYSHQVGGHSTMFRFSRRAVCKQLNNRENEFYERIEKRHPDMLRFLPRYIGVLNVTFSKGARPSKQAIVSTSKDTVNDCPQVPSTMKPSNGSIDPFDDQSHSLPVPGEVTEPPRIVSQSQQVGEVPRVILDQNRHIVPFSFFASPEKPRNAGPHHAQAMEKFSISPYDNSTNGDVVIGTTVRGRSSSRPRLPEHSASWGTTTVNSKLREQVLREVFGPPTIHQHKGHAKGHSTHPRLRTPSHRKTRLSEIGYNSHRENGSMPVDQWRRPVPKDMYHPAQQEEKLATPYQAEQIPDMRSTSTSKLDTTSRDLEIVKGTASSEPQGAAVDCGGQLQRRHSGMGMRRRRRSDSENGAGDLEHFGDDGYSRDGKDGVFAMEDPSPPHPAPMSIPSSAVWGDLETSAPSVHATETQDNKLSEAPKKNIADPRNPFADLGTQHLPLNPKEAQTQNPDQRVVYFLLLEDLTAGMGRPCVLDLKMGTRQYGIEANRKKMESQRRKCKTTTSQQLGVRICGMQTYNVKKKQPAYEDKYFGRDLKAGREFRDALTRFLYDGISYSSVSSRIPTILDKISKLESMVRRLPGYRFYASSLLMLYDAEPQRSQKAIEEAQKVKNENAEREKAKEEKQRRSSIELKIVDFANCVTGEDELPANAPCPPHRPNDIDRGYLRGLRTLRMYFQRILLDINQEEFVERGEGEGMAQGLGGGKQGPPEGSIEDDAGEVSI